ncbi:hypothetical protein CALCODRAFT_277835 [Calocera cornea HHB12733]|uniref:AAA+ ATPase domain-containing protein n=1 Tax=Calocera cornea HHB12733 TaxID=1353952 RepID=A0A165JPV1_9BASI|nr:hypothetical protein CALCODRAFT_277835 [Calocera cornea HHB12733]
MGKQEEPITVDESPVIEKGPPALAHPFFTSRPASSTSTIPRSNGAPTRMKVALSASWPDAESQHVRGPTHDSSAMASGGGRCLPFKRRRLNHRSHQEFADFDYSSLAPNLARFQPSSPGLVDVSGDEVEVPLLRAHQRHPALARLAGPNDDQHSELWCEKYRPLQAAEVLGNEAHAMYLKDWLQALELRVTDDRQLPNGIDASRPTVNGEKKRTVIRTVDKSQRRKRKRRTDDWIVSDDELSGTEWPEDPIEDWGAADDGTLSDHGSTASSAGPPPFLTTPRPTRHLPAHDFSQRLANAILLSGPPGCGKTAAVYACAHELGWDVFEVYPGIGKRSGAGLMSLVGEVGRNHLVRKAPVTGGVPFEKLLFAGNKSARYQLSSGTPEQPISLDSSSPPDTGYGSIESPASTGMDRTVAQARLPTPEASGVRQSVILLEEVDVLFREDAGFWQAVIGLLKDSHRPVIMTCNDPTLVPIDDLPLQEQLRFEAPEVTLQDSYLQCIARVEGHNLPRKVVSGIREGSSDLRQAINSLQWTCSGKYDLKSLRKDRTVSRSFDQDLNEASLAPVRRLECYASFLDYRSFVDAYLRRPAGRSMQALEPDRSEPSLDDEQGHVTVRKPHPADADVGIATYLHDEQFADEIDATAISQFSHVLPTLDREPAAESTGITSLLTYLAPLIPISSYLLPRAPVIVDYAPYVRAMVRADDEGAEADEAQEAARLSRAGRPLRLAAAKFNTRLPYARWISLDDLALAEARRGSLGF